MKTDYRYFYIIFLNGGEVSYRNNQIQLIHKNKDCYIFPDEKMFFNKLFKKYWIAPNSIINEY